MDSRTLWHRWFAWYPVTLTGGGWAWFRTIERKGLAHFGPGESRLSWTWDYRRAA